MEKLHTRKKESVYWDIVRRNFGVYSRLNQKKIKKARICIVGIGCDGGLAALVLARLGLGYLTLIDPDVYEKSNINRQPMARFSTVGQKKVNVARDLIRDINPFVDVSIEDAALDEENAHAYLCGHDVVLQCVDDMVSRVILHRAAKELGIPAITMTGQPPYRAFVSTLMPAGPTYDELFNLPYCQGKQFSGHHELAEKTRTLKYDRAHEANQRGATRGWHQAFRAGSSGWGITPERAYLTGTLQAHAAIRLVLGKAPLAPAPKAVIIDLAGEPELVQIMDPPNGVFWDYREF